MIARGLHYVAGAALAALLLLGLTSNGLAQTDALSQKATEAAEITAIADQNGYVRIIVLLDSPISTNQIRPDATSIANLKAQVAAGQDGILAAHFGSAANPSPGAGWATSTTLTFTTVAAHNGYLFRAKFTNAAGTATTTVATLTVNAAPAAPVVTQNPSNLTVTAGQQATFTAAATGTPTPTVIWQVSTNGGATYNNIAWATSTTLPSNLPQWVAPFEAFVEGTLARMPPPVSHMGHPHWLGALRVYRENMIRGGSDASIALLDHPRNMGDVEQVVPAVTQMARRLASAWQGRMRAWSATRQAPLRKPAPETELGRSLRLRQELGALVCGMIASEPPAIDVVHIGNIAALAPPLPPGARLLRVADPSEGGSQRSFNVEVPEAEDATGMLVVYVTAGFLACWDRLEEDLERFLSSRRRVVLVFITDRFRPLEFATHSYLLTVLATSFPARKFAATLEVYDASPTPTVSRRPLPRSIRALAWRARSALIERWPALLGTEAPPATFSALVVSVRPACQDLGAHRSTKIASAS